MFTLFKRKPQGKTASFKIDGMHCTSCSMNIDAELEETEGVVSAQTNYAKSCTSVVFDEKKVSPQKLQLVIEKLGYQVQSDSE